MLSTKIFEELSPFCVSYICLSGTYSAGLGATQISQDETAGLHQGMTSTQNIFGACVEMQTVITLLQAVRNSNLYY